MIKMIKAPFTAEQVDALNQFQRGGQFHPFTCPGHEGGGDRDLIATRNGWICCHCDYKQDWANESMVSASKTFVQLRYGGRAFVGGQQIVGFTEDAEKAAG